MESSGEPASKGSTERGGNAAQNIFLHPHKEELQTLADLAGIRAPGNIMKILIELLSMNVQPAELHQLLRSVLSSKNRSQRTTSKHSSRRPQVHAADPTPATVAVPSVTSQPPASS